MKNNNISSFTNRLRTKQLDGPSKMGNVNETFPKKNINHQKINLSSHKPFDIILLTPIQSITKFQTLFKTWHSTYKCWANLSNSHSLIKCNLCVDCPSKKKFFQKYRGISSLELKQLQEFGLVLKRYLLNLRGSVGWAFTSAFGGRYM